jgi:Protein kinase domain
MSGGSGPEPWAERPPSVEGLLDPRPLGRGGFGTVYRAWQVGVGREVALKVGGHVLSDERQRRRFLREANAAGRLSSHAHIVAVYGAGVTDDGRPYLVMELCSRGSLVDRLRRGGPLPAEEVRSVGVSIADALATAHAAGVLHRDVKPGNILLDEYGVAKLADFGLAAVLDASGDTSVTREGLTPAYAPPEAFAYARPTTRLDVYGLAATLYALLSGRPPRMASWPPASLSELTDGLHAPIPPVPGTHPDLLAVLARALDPDPESRTPGAAVLRDELRALPAAATPGPSAAGRSAGLPAGGAETLPSVLPAGPPSVPGERSSTAGALPAAEAPSEPPAGGMPDAPAGPGAPSVPEARSGPGVPSVPGARSGPGVPSVPGARSGPGVPSEPDPAAEGATGAVAVPADTAVPGVDTPAVPRPGAAVAGTETPAAARPAVAAPGAGGASAGGPAGGSSGAGAGDGEGRSRGRLGVAAVLAAVLIAVIAAALLRPGGNHGPDTGGPDTGGPDTGGPIAGGPVAGGPIGASGTNPATPRPTLTPSGAGRVTTGPAGRQSSTPRTGPSRPPAGGTTAPPPATSRPATTPTPTGPAGGSGTPPGLVACSGSNDGTLCPTRQTCWDELVPVGSGDSAPPEVSCAGPHRFEAFAAGPLAGGNPSSAIAHACSPSRLRARAVGDVKGWKRDEQQVEIPGYGQFFFCVAAPKDGSSVTGARFTTGA